MVPVTETLPLGAMLVATFPDIVNGQPACDTPEHPLCVRTSVPEYDPDNVYVPEISTHVAFVVVDAVTVIGATVAGACVVVGAAVVVDTVTGCAGPCFSLGRHFLGHLSPCSGS